MQEFFELGNVTNCYYVLIIFEVRESIYDDFRVILCDSDSDSDN